MSIEADPSVPVAGHDDRLPRRYLRVLALALGVVGMDQATKLWATSSLSGGESVAVLGDLLGFRLIYNPGAAFSIGTEITWVFTLVAAIAVVAIIRTARKVRSRLWAVALGLVLGGAATHLLDRLFRAPGFARGHVVDFIDYAGLFVGNVADLSLVAGGLLIVVLYLRGVGIDGGRAER